ncbi:hypothetical protein BDW02DRAFT_546895 [Decorospora gaudefroyi]|uniref:20S-pre-rRNA D-site endonuclease NOB1 n=1 Tax=Decorospora gaudefroyi TaxID=184978 RepID=A0A6A5KJP2_9PLEO|nr:hypothetical protein BDW02DRAFT_546895 [Decorospora gaudefroyi]
MSTPMTPQEKPIHSLILDTGPLIRNAVSISTLVNTASELYTTPAILSEIRDAATRSRVQTTLMPFLTVRTPRPASYDAVVAFSKRTGDHAVLSRQDLGILALAYEVHCERNGGDWGLREVPGGLVKRRQGDEGARGAEGEVLPAEKEKSEQDGPAVEVESKTADLEATEEGWAQPKGKRAAKGRAPKPVKFNFEPTEEAVAESSQTEEQNDKPISGEELEDGGVAITPEQVQEQIQEQVVAQVQDQIHEQVQDQVHEQLQSKGEEALESQALQQAEQQIEEQVQEQVQQQLREQVGEEGLIQQSAAIEIPHTNVHVEQKMELSVTPQTAVPTEPISNTDNLEQDMADLAISQAPTQQFTPPQTDSAPSDSDSDGDWITPENLTAHQIKDTSTTSSTKTKPTPQMDTATMTTDLAMQNVLLQMNLALLSPNMQRIKHLTTKVLRCHACFHIVKDIAKQFCPRCGQPTLQRVSCSTNAAGEFQIHLKSNYQWNKRGDRFSIPKPIAGTANNKWSGRGGGKGGWGRGLVLVEDQKEVWDKGPAGRKDKERERDLMDRDYLPGILSGERARGGGRVRVGAGRDVNARKRG